MRKLLFILPLLASAHLTLGQTTQYQVEVDNHRAGYYRQSTETNQNTHTFTSLSFELLTLTDTLRYFSDAHYVESDSGFLESVSWSQRFVDSLSYEIRFEKDSITYLNRMDSTSIKLAFNGVVFGPEEIRSLSKKRLDTIGSKICYPTYSIELQKIIQVERKLVGYSVIKAEKLYVIEESIGSKTTTGKFDKDFRLVQNTSPSPFGEIRLTRTKQTLKPQFFETDSFEEKRLLSNIRFPDPNQIHSMKLTIEDLDSLSISRLRYHNQTITKQDSSSLVLLVSNKKQPLSAWDTLTRSEIESFWRKAKTKTALDSLLQDSVTLNKRIEQIALFAKSQPYPAVAFHQLATEAQIPARLVYGYSYDQWFWHPKAWVELAIDGFWKTYDPTDEIEPNPALKIALFKGKIGANLNSSYFSNISTIHSIQVQSFVLDGKKHSVSSQVLPYYFENPVYENEGLGLRFNIPDGFIITDDGTKSPGLLFLTLENEYEEKIQFFQIVTPSRKQTEQLAKNKISDYIGDPDLELTKDKKLNFWSGFKEKRGALAIIQGSSYLFITIEHEDPDFMTLILTRKNLHLKY